MTRSLRCLSGVAPAMPAALIAVAFVASTAVAAAPNCTNPISFCPCRITTAGETYTIASADQDLLSTGIGGCIRIQAPYVTLDLGSAIITASVPTDSVGIHVSSLGTESVIEGATSAPATVQGFAAGIQVDAHSVTLKNLVAQDNSIGIIIGGNAVYGSALSAIRSTQIGILIRSVGGGPFLNGVTVSDTLGPGVELSYAQGAFIANLTATANATYGVWLRASSRNVIANFTASQNTIAGIYIGCFRSGGLLSGTCPSYPPIPPSNANIIASLADPSSVNGPVQPAQEYGVIIGDGNHGNRVVGVTGSGNGTGTYGADAADYNLNCQGNVWEDNQFSTTIPSGPDSCIH